MKVLILVCLLALGVFASTPAYQEQLLKDLFEQWKQVHGKVYSTATEHKFRFMIFSQNYLDILKFNEAQDTATLALNEFADLSSQEFGMLYTGAVPSKSDAETKVFDVKDLPSSWDWRPKGAVTPVKNQGQCGSCWAFSAVAALEGLYFLNNSQLVSFSEQNIVDCVQEDSGCNGGWPMHVYDYTAKGGIESEADYPYFAAENFCNFTTSLAYDVNTGYYNVTPKDENQLKSAIVQQPVSVCVQANQLAFQFYQGGVIKRLCGHFIDHCILAVGYDTVKGEETYLVKNSWGEKWGNDGYVYISTDGSANDGYGVCGILTYPTIPYKN